MHQIEKVAESDTKMGETILGGRDEKESHGSVQALEIKEEASSLDQEVYTQLEDLRKRIAEIYKRDYIMWKQIAKCQWMKETDANTTYFYRVASIRRRQN